MLVVKTRVCSQATLSAKQNKNSSPQFLTTIELLHLLTDFLKMFGEFLKMSGVSGKCVELFLAKVPRQPVHSFPEFIFL